MSAIFVKQCECTRWSGMGPCTCARRDLRVARSGDLNPVLAAGAGRRAGDCAPLSQEQIIKADDFFAYYHGEPK